MKFSDVLCQQYTRSLKYTRNEKIIKFRPEMRMELKGSVAGNMQKFPTNACIQEMFLMMACLKKNEFDQTMCSDDVKKFRNCNENYFSNRSQKLKDQRSGVLTPGLKELSAPQVNTLLKNFPVKK